jgi:transcriptional regulator with XRE-family HTH domain
VTQEELVARLQALGVDIDQPALSRIETGDRQVTDVEILGICEALGVGVPELFKGLRLPSQR